MKALLDMPVSPALLEVLQEFGHEGVHCYQIDKSTATDSDLLELAWHEGRVIITADLDFPRLLALGRSAGPGIILFRGGNYSELEMGDLLTRVLRTVATEVLEHSITVVDKKRIRITRLSVT